MNYGYPGANSQFENHNVSEESFWPSFTDIMMVIVMVFLMVTVAVILNNWTLIAKLTTSIEAQKAATSLADNRQEKNIGLENELSAMQQKLSALSIQFEEEKTALEQTQAKLAFASEDLSTKEQTLSLKELELSGKEQSLASIENKLTTLNEKYAAEQQSLNNSNQQLSASELKLSNTDKQLINIKQQLTNKEAIIVSLDNKLLDAGQKNTETQDSLEQSQKALELSQKNLEQIQTELADEKKIAASGEKQLDESNAAITELQTAFDDLEKETQSLSQLTETQKIWIKEKILAQTNLEKQFEVSQTQVSELEKNKAEAATEIATLKTTVDEKQLAAVALQTSRNDMDGKFAELLGALQLAKQSLTDNEKSFTDNQKSFKVEKIKLQEKLTLLQKQSDAKDQTISENESTQTELKEQLDEKLVVVGKLENTIAVHKVTAKKIGDAISKSEESLKSFEGLLSDAENQLIEKDKRIEELSVEQNSGNSQLVSLQGEYDSLDNKYQKLLRPARSSKGKFISTVTYKKVGGKKIIRFKSSPNSSYKTVSKSQLAKSLNSLKKKHKDNLYVKVIIPKNSGLSYNEAWRFTINIQKKYDYYYNN